MDMPNDSKAPDQEVVERVVTWHNRLPGARRIEAHHVTGIGIVALPFAAAVQPAAPWKLVLRRLRPAPARFAEPLIDSIGTARAATFGWVHGAALRPGPADWPLRTATVEGDPAADLQWRYLRTAAVEFGSRRIRVLMGGSGAKAPVLGARHWNPHSLRGMLVGAATVLVLACGSALFVRHGQATAAGPLADQSAPEELVPGPLPAASATASAPGLKAEPAPTLAPAPAPAPATAAASASASATITAPTSGAESSDSAPGKKALVLPGAPRSTIGVDRAASSNPRSPSAGPSPNLAPAQPRATSAPQQPVAWSLATKITRNRAATELRILLINSSVNKRSGSVRVEAVQTPGGWRAVMGPFASREAAEQTRESLRAQGVQLESIGF